MVTAAAGTGVGKGLTYEFREPVTARENPM
jgi:hypothetical protein